MRSDELIGIVKRVEIVPGIPGRPAQEQIYVEWLVPLVRDE